MFSLSPSLTFSFLSLTHKTINVTILKFICNHI
jgi:hypothetical protein